MASDLRTDCPRETDVLDLARRGQWPTLASAEIRDHVSACATCREVAELATIMNAEFETALDEAHVPASGLVWWRAQRRAHEDAVREAARPVRNAQLVAIACAALAVLVTGWFSIDWLREQFTWVGAALPSMPVGADLFSRSAPLFRIAVVLAGLAAVVGPVAIYVLLEDD